MNFQNIFARDQTKLGNRSVEEKESFSFLIANAIVYEPPDGSDVPS